MKLRTLLSIGLLGLSPSLVLAQSHAEAQAPSAPKAPKAARAATIAVPALPAADPAFEFALVPPSPPAPPAPIAEQPPTPPAAPKAPSAVTPSAATAPPAPPAPPRPVGQMINVQIEVTLSDTKGPAKTVVLTVADGEFGKNRTVSYVGEARNTSFSFNADARPTVSGNKVRLYLSAEATVPPSADGKAGAAQVSLRQEQTLILSDGDSVEIARAADPVSERSFALSVKVKIQR